MTRRYERQCWYCGSKNMENMTDYFKCRDCGATWNFVPQLGPEILEQGLGGDDYSTYKLGSKKGRPSAATIRQARLTREKRSS